VDLRWQASHNVAAGYCFDGDRLFTQTARYDVPTPHWCAYIRGDEVGESPELAEAGAIVERHIRRAKSEELP
jgi:hypothetical protein